MQAAQRKLQIEKFTADTNTETEYQQFVEWLKTVSIAEVESILKENDTAMAETSPIGEVNLNLVSNIEGAVD